MKQWALIFVAGLIACGDSVRSDANVDVVDGAIDGDWLSTDANDSALSDVDAINVVPPSDVADVLDVSSSANADASSDVLDAGDGTIPCIGPEPSPPNVGRSCSLRDGAVDPRLCNEVHYCGGYFTAGSPNAYVGPGERPIRNFYRFESCDYSPAAALSGYIDAYEVTVARFRTWVNRGMPSPAVGDTVAEGVRWTQSGENHLRMDPFPFYDSVMLMNDLRPRIEGCTWTANEGPNESRPMNCHSLSAAVAFCAWDGKQLVNEIAWEYVARNRGTTEVPFGDSRSDASICNIADVGGWHPAMGGTLCPSRPLPLAVTDRPLDVTSDPPGVFGMFGGLREYVYRTVWNSPGIVLRGRAAMCDGQRRTRLVVEGEAVEYDVGGLMWLPPLGYLTGRGASWYDSIGEFEYHRFAASLIGVEVATVATGFRCGRRERPVR